MAIHNICQHSNQAMHQSSHSKRTSTLTFLQHCAWNSWIFPRYSTAACPMLQFSTSWHEDRHGHGDVFSICDECLMSMAAKQSDERRRCLWAYVWVNEAGHLGATDSVLPFECDRFGAHPLGAGTFGRRRLGTTVSALCCVIAANV